DETLKERAFLVRHQVSCQAGLHRRYQLESRLPRSVNLFCQHALAVGAWPAVLCFTSGLKLNVQKQPS
ncbi:hypothetical protein, partial [Salipiger thiooxidans]|uniref:hypothetical protein n=1 Tax=Salipiger thiooxidans TaxID=282683 RepID=UPI001A95C838